MLLDQNFDSASVHDRHEIDERRQRERRHHRLLGGVSALIVLALAGAAWYVYPILKRHETSLAKIVGIQTSLDNLNTGLEQQKSKAAEGSNDQERLRAQVTQLGRELRSRVDAARKQANQTAEDLFHRVETQIESQIEGVKTRVAGLETSREGDQAQIAALGQELGQVRRELTQQTQELSEMRRQITDDGTGTARQLASLQAVERQDVGAIHDQLAVRRIDFEVSKGHSHELAPGISLGITGTNVAYRRADGWMWVLPDHRTIWLRQQGSQEPVTFYGVADGKKRELVITSVTKGSVAGYLLLPKDANAANPVAVRGGGEQPAGE